MSFTLALIRDGSCETLYKTSRLLKIASGCKRCALLDMLTLEPSRYPGWFHKLHAEPGEDKITFANDVANWIIARAGGQKTGTLLDVQSKL